MSVVSRSLVILLHLPTLYFFTIFTVSRIMDAPVFKLTGSLKLTIAEEIQRHRDNLNRKKDKTEVHKAINKLIASQNITDKMQQNQVKKVCCTILTLLLDSHRYCLGRYSVLLQQCPGPRRTRVQRPEQPAGVRSSSLATGEQGSHSGADCGENQE